MAEIQTNPSHVAEFGDINLGDVQLFSDATGIRALVRIDAPTVPPSEGSQITIDKIYGFDGVDWERINSSGGALNVAITPGTVVTSPAPVAVPGGPAVPLPVPPAGTRAFNVQNNTGAAGTLILVRELGGAPGTGIMLTNRAVFVYDSAVASLEAEHVAGPAGVIHVTFEG